MRGTKVIKEKSEVLLMEYASGTLDEACALLAATYVAICPDARHYMRQCENLGGVLIEYCCEPVAMNEHSMQDVLKRLEQKQEIPNHDSVTPTQKKGDKLPQPLSEYLGETIKQEHWKHTWPGIEILDLPVADKGYSAVIIKMAPGARSPRHHHPGIEITLVLEGSFSDETGTYGYCELIIADGDNPHRPIAGDQGCTCLIALEHPVRFEGIWGLLQE